VRAPRVAVARDDDELERPPRRFAALLLVDERVLLFMATPEREFGQIGLNKFHARQKFGAGRSICRYKGRNGFIVRHSVACRCHQL